MSLVDEFRERAVRAERERDEYAERVRALTNAASSAAASTVVAIERLQEFQIVIDAAVNWLETGSESLDSHAAAARRLAASIEAHQARVRGRS